VMKAQRQIAAQERYRKLQEFLNGYTGHHPNVERVKSDIESHRDEINKCLSQAEECEEALQDFQEVFLNP